MNATTILANMLRDGRATVEEVRAINDAYRIGLLAERKRCAEIAGRTRYAEFYGNPDQKHAASFIANIIESGQ